VPDARVDSLLAAARVLIGPRVGPMDLADRARDALLVDIRPVEQRSRDGELPGAIPIDRNVLEWRLDPTSPYRLAEMSADRRVVLICNEGYASTLGAATLRSIGVDATDLVGGFQSWRSSSR